MNVHDTSPSPRPFRQLRLFREKSGIRRFFGVTLEKEIPAQAGMTARIELTDTFQLRLAWEVEAAMQPRHFSELFSDLLSCCV